MPRLNRTQSIEFYKNKITPFMERHNMNMSMFSRAVGVTPAAVGYWKSGASKITDPKLERVETYMKKHEYELRKNMPVVEVPKPSNELILPNIPPMMLKDLVAKFISKKDITYSEFASRIGVSTVTLVSFMRDNQFPHERTLDMIRDYLHKQGMLGRYLLDKLSNREDPQENIDKKYLDIMGIKLPPSEESGDPEMIKQRDQWRNARLIGTIVSSNIMSDIEKKSVLKHLLPHSFSAL